MIMKNTIGNNLKIWRSKYGYSQDKIAKYLGITRENISYFENGEREIPIKHLEKLSDLFGISPVTFYEYSNYNDEFEIAFAFRNKENISNETMQNIAKFQKIISNYMKMSKKLNL